MFSNSPSFRSRTNTTDGGRLDISARGLQSAFERTFFDVGCLMHMPHQMLLLVFLALYNARNEKEKRSLYQDWVLKTEKGSFEPLVFLTTGGSGPSCTKVKSG